MGCARLAARRRRRRRPRGDRVLDDVIHSARIAEATRANALVRAGEQLEFATSTFGGDAVAVGAAIMPLEMLVRDARPRPSDVPRSA